MYRHNVHGSDFHAALNDAPDVGRLVNRSITRSSAYFGCHIVDANHSRRQPHAVTPGGATASAAFLPRVGIRRDFIVTNTIRLTLVSLVQRRRPDRE